MFLFCINIITFADKVDVNLKSGGSVSCDINGQMSVMSFLATCVPTPYCSDMHEARLCAYGWPVDMSHNIDKSYIDEYNNNLTVECKIKENPIVETNLTNGASRF
jgi:hypothetical protein